MLISVLVSVWAFLSSVVMYALSVCQMFGMNLKTCENSMIRTLSSWWTGSSEHDPLLLKHDYYCYYYYTRLTAFFPGLPGYQKRKTSCAPYLWWCVFSNDHNTTSHRHLHRNGRFPDNPGLAGSLSALHPLLSNRDSCDKWVWRCSLLSDDFGHLVLVWR